MIKSEEKSGIFDKAILNEFSNKVKINKNMLMQMIYNLKMDNKEIVGVSAPAKGMTLLNYCGINAQTLNYVTEKSTLKIGRFTPGGHIPVYSDDMLIKDKPDFALLLAWNFADEIISNLTQFRNEGGKFIIPIPVPKII